MEGSPLCRLEGGHPPLQVGWGAAPSETCFAQIFSLSAPVESAGSQTSACQISNNSAKNNCFESIFPKLPSSQTLSFSLSSKFYYWDDPYKFTPGQAVSALNHNHAFLSKVDRNGHTQQVTENKAHTLSIQNPNHYLSPDSKL
jgi:hypothetical protein